MDDPAKIASAGLGEYAYRDRSAADVLKDIVGNLQEIIRSEARLARVEVKEEAGKAWTAGQSIVIGAVVGLYGGLFVLLGIVYGLSSIMAPWLAALLVGVALAIVAGVMITAGRSRLKEVNATPEKTIGTVKENLEWMKDQTR